MPPSSCCQGFTWWCHCSSAGWSALTKAQSAQSISTTTSTSSASVSIAAGRDAVVFCSCGCSKTRFASTLCPMRPSWSERGSLATADRGYCNYLRDGDSQIARFATGVAAVRNLLVRCRPQVVLHTLGLGRPLPSGQAVGKSPHEMLGTLAGALRSGPWWTLTYQPPVGTE